ncbi:hypothetical protein J6590_069060 [Homalodisca vitripennis]|nr:hypothetical protein J6590_069060 [Homalodisca vitripennis]
MQTPMLEKLASSFKAGDTIRKEVNVPSNKIPKSLNSVNRGVHLVVSTTMKTWYRKIDRTKDFWTVDQPVQNSIEEENILSLTPDTKSDQSEQSSNVIERIIPAAPAIKLSHQEYPVTLEQRKDPFWNQPNSSESSTTRIINIVLDVPGWTTSWKGSIKRIAEECHDLLHKLLSAHVTQHHVCRMTYSR